MLASNVAKEAWKLLSRLRYFNFWLKPIYVSTQLPQKIATHLVVKKDINDKLGSSTDLIFKFLIHWGPAICTTDIEVDSLIRTFKARIVNQ
jgi:hypothetical protein